MNSMEYWQQRSEQIARRQHLKADRYVADLKREYEKAIYSIKRDLEVFYHRFADNNGIVSMATAKRLLTSSELKEFRMALEEFADLAKDNLGGRWIKQLNNAYYKTRVSRLEALQVQIRQQVEMLNGSQQAGTRAVLSEAYQDTYYRTIYEVQKGIGIGASFTVLTPKTVEKVITKPWIGANFSQRIWNDKEKLLRELETSLSQALIRGDSIDRTTQTLAKRMGISYSNAARIIRTETSHVVGEATYDGYKDSGVVQQYEFLATLDGRTSEVCQSLDGKVFNLSEKQEGINWPPLHPNCRSTTTAYFDDELDVGERIARDGKRVYHVLGDLSYKEWMRKYVQDNRTG